MRSFLRGAGLVREQEGDWEGDPAVGASGKERR